MNEIRRHMEEYLESKNNIRSKFRRKTQFHPENFADFIKNSLIESKNFEGFKERLGGSNVRARKAHDYYGWMSKKGRLGACRGAIYRSQDYMKIPLRDRSGERKYKSRGEQYSSHHVHIEHSIPVNTILEYFWQHKDILLEMDEQKKLHEWRELIFQHLNQKECQNCGFNDSRGLVFDHIFNDRKIDMKTRGSRGHNWWKKYADNPILTRKRLQVLCQNCNHIKQVEEMKNTGNPDLIY